LIGTCKEERLTVEESFLLWEQEGKGGGGVKRQQKGVSFYCSWSESQSSFKGTGHRNYAPVLCCPRNKITRELAQITHHFKYILFTGIFK
jgi:hypothetical protein